MKKTIFCPCCKADVDTDSTAGRGIALNTRLSLQAEAVTLEKQLAKTNPRIEPDVHADLLRRLEGIQASLIEFNSFIEPETARKSKAADVTWKLKGIDQFYAQENGDFFEFNYETDDDVTYCRTLAELGLEEVDTLIETLTKFRDKHTRKDSCT